MTTYKTYQWDFTTYCRMEDLSFDLSFDLPFKALPETKRIRLNVVALDVKRARELLIANLNNGETNIELFNEFLRNKIVDNYDYFLKYVDSTLMPFILEKNPTKIHEFKCFKIEITN